MRRGKHLLELLALAAALGPGCADASSPPGRAAANTVEAGAGDVSLPEPTATEIRALVEGNTRFALDLFGLLAEEDGNLAFSPASISVAFGMTYAGARGETSDQMRSALRFGGAGEAVHAAFGALLRDWNDTG
ncbi:MAG: serpin family protein, partial [Acidobacteriota bacterium]